MKAQLIVLLTLLLTACHQPAVKLPEITAPGQDTIIDPIERIPFDLKYDPVIKVTPDIFEKGSKGTGSLGLIIDTAGKILNYKVLEATITLNKQEIYNYQLDQDSDKIKRLIPLLNRFVKSIRTEKIAEPETSGTQAYMVVVHFE